MKRTVTLRCSLLNGIRTGLRVTTYTIMLLLHINEQVSSHHKHVTFKKQKFELPNLQRNSRVCVTIQMNST